MCITGLWVYTPVEHTSVNVHNNNVAYKCIIHHKESEYGEKDAEKWLLWGFPVKFRVLK